MSLQMPQDLKDGPTIHIVDDDDSVCRGLNSLFRSVGLEARTYGSARDFFDAGAVDRPGCIVLDVRLPGASGLDVQAQLADRGIRLPIVLITGYGDIPMSVRAMKAGAVDQDIRDAVTTAIERDRKQRAVDDEVAAIRSSFATLSTREQQVMTLVATGKMNKQVAGELGLAEFTVKIHRSAAIRKMGARSLADLVRMAELLKPRAN
jgi:FixJ family two-component response regulator